MDAEERETMRMLGQLKRENDALKAENAKLRKAHAEILSLGDFYTLDRARKISLAVLKDVSGEEAKPEPFKIHSCSKMKDGEWGFLQPGKVCGACGWKHSTKEPSNG